MTWPQAGNQVTVFEQESRPGGLAAGFKEPEWDWELEKFYHHWFQSDHSILSLIDELGLSKKVQFYQPTTVMEYNGDFYPFDTPIAALKFPGPFISGEDAFWIRDGFSALSGEMAAVGKIHRA